MMAPLTRMRAGSGRIPTALMAEYYVQRAAAGLIVTEATAISQQGTGCPNTPGIYTDEQVAGWQRVTGVVHGAGGRIFLQLWHMGRISHPSFQPSGGLPVAPSAIAPRSGQALTETGPQPYVTPRALETGELPGIVSQYAAGAERAKSAGFDGVEIHNANGYLLDQFLRDGTNHRTDEYGGPVENRARLTLAVAAAVTKVWGAERVGIRFSPGGVFNDMHDSNPLETFSYVLQELNRFHLAYAHVIVSTEDDLRHGAAVVPLAALRQAFHGSADCRQRLHARDGDAGGGGKRSRRGGVRAVVSCQSRPARALPVERAAEHAGRIDVLWRSGKGLYRLPGTGCSARQEVIEITNRSQLRQARRGGTQQRNLHRQMQIVRWRGLAAHRGVVR
jgi:N-ethylmaleimide reductase